MYQLEPQGAQDDAGRVRQGSPNYFERCAGCHGVRARVPEANHSPDITLGKGTDYLKVFIALRFARWYAQLADLR